MPGPGPQPPTDGPFFVLITVTARTPEDVDKLAENFAKGASKALETGAKKFIVGRKVSENAITVFEAYDDVKGFESVHSPKEKTKEYYESRAITEELKESMDATFYRIS